MRTSVPIIQAMGELIGVEVNGNLDDVDAIAVAAAVVVTLSDKLSFDLGYMTCGLEGGLPSCGDCA